MNLNQFDELLYLLAELAELILPGRDCSLCFAFYFIAVGCILRRRFFFFPTKEKMNGFKLVQRLRRELGYDYGKTQVKEIE